MPLLDPSHPLYELLQRDRRYTLDAYVFVLESLSFAQESLGMGAEQAAEDLGSSSARRPGSMACSSTGISRRRSWLPGASARPTTSARSSST
jgi:hypothetical protein